jgi:hypothetical protein
MLRPKKKILLVKSKTLLMANEGLIKPIIVDEKLKYL